MDEKIYDNLDEIFIMADEIGKLIRETSVYKKYHELSLAVNEEHEINDLYEEYIVTVRDIEERQKLGDIIEHYEVENLKNLHDKITKNMLVIDYIEAQRKYAELIQLIQGEISKE